MLPAAARSHYRRLQRLQASVVGSARRMWRRMEPRGRWSQQYRESVGPALVALMAAGQVAAARESDAYVADVLNELSFGPPTEPGVVVPRSLSGWAGDGRPVDTLLEQSVVRAGKSYSTAVDAAAVPDLDAAAAQALAEAESWIDMVAATLIADAARAAESVAMVQREWVDGYVRMLNPPSCSRCAILAGRFYLWNEGFLRHPRCDCVHIPAPEADYTDLTVNPDRYFHSLTAAEQDRIFTKAGAKAIRDEADISQVVNARRGMTTAQQNPRGWIPKGRMIRTEVFGRGVFTTTEGVTKRGVGRKAMGPGRPVRLMPESIYEIADGDRAEAVRLLRRYGYIAD
jgi:hypothetical protein